MLNSIHVPVAAAIVRMVPDPALAWPLAIASHIILDTVPHWNWHPVGTKARLVASLADIAVSFGLSYWLASISPHFWVTLIACLLATVPDLIQGPYYVWGYKPHWLDVFVTWESKRQKWAWMKPWMGMVTQVITLAAAVLVLIRVS